MSLQSLPPRFSWPLLLIGTLALAALFAALHAWTVAILVAKMRLSDEAGMYLSLAYWIAFALAFDGLRRFLGLPKQPLIARLFRRRS